jgi:hypothetical protein
MKYPLILFFLVLCLLIGGCSPDDTDTDATAVTTVTTSTTQPTTTTAAGAATEAVGAVFEVTYVEGEGCTWVGPSKVPIGKHSFVLHDPTGELEAIYVTRLDADRTLQDLIDAAPAPGKWFPKPVWVHYTVDLDSGKETDDGTVFAKLLRMPGEHTILASLYDGAPPDERIHWNCIPSFTVVESSE